MVPSLTPAVAVDRVRLSRIRAPVGMGHFVHFNWFWLDRALIDTEIKCCLIRGGPRGGVVGCLAYGPHERIDLDSGSRMPNIGEIYHIVIDRRHAGRGHGRSAIMAGLQALCEANRDLISIRVSHHAENLAAAGLYARLGFVEIGVKIDGETGIRDKLLELDLHALPRVQAIISADPA